MPLFASQQPWSRLQDTLFKSKKTAQAEIDRASREKANLHQRFLQLPAELRNQIYEYVIPTGKEVRRSQYSHIPYRLPKILHSCRQIREEVLSLFYGRNVFVIVLQHLTLHRSLTLRVRDCANLLPEGGTTAWRKIRIESSSSCFHSDGFAVLAKVDVMIDRTEGTVSCQPRGSSTLAQCCRGSQKEYCKRLTAEVKSMKLQDRERKLRRQDFEKLARKRDECKPDWTSPRQVLPSRSERFGGLGRT